jgi:HSP20 family protein
MAITDLIPWRKQAPVSRASEQPFLPVRRDIDRLFDEFFDLAPFRAFEEAWPSFSPRVDIVETDREIRVQAELPGLNEQDFQVSLAQNTLTIRGEKRQEHEERGQNYTRTERTYGSFQRSVPLPGSIDPDKADAVFKNGVLTVTFPKTGTPQKKIPIKGR